MKKPNEMTQIEKRKIFTLIMGKCWHGVNEEEEHKTYKDYPIQYYCRTCDSWYSKNDASNPFTLSGFNEWMTFAGEQEWFEKMQYNICRDGEAFWLSRIVIHRFYGHGKGAIEWSLNKQLEWLYNNVELWGLEDCTREQCSGECDDCVGGKIKSKALEAWEEMKWSV